MLLNISKRKKLKNIFKKFIKRIDKYTKIVYSNTRNKQNRSGEGRWEYRKGKQEYHITPGSRIREIGTFVELDA